MYEAAATLEPVGAGIWVPPNAMQVLARLGLSEAVAGAGVALERVELCHTGGVLQRIDLRAIAARCGHPTVSVHRAALQGALAERLRAGTLHLDKRCTGFADEGQRVVVRFADGAQVQAGVLVGADGLHSVIRRTLFPEVTLRYAGQTCYRGVAEAALPEALARTSREIWNGAARFGFSALGAARVYWFAPITASAGGADEPGTVQARLAARFAGFPAPVPALLDRTPEAAIIRTDLHDFPPIARWWQGRAVLLGDAAHAMTPNLGQGGAQAIEDAFVLAESLARYPTAREAFRAYEAARRPRASRVVRLSWLLGKLAHARSRLLRVLRNAALRSTPAWISRKQFETLYTLNY